MKTLLLYHFRYFDLPRRRWIQARHVLEAPAIRCRYPDYEIFGAAEIRHVPHRAAHFTPFAVAVPKPTVIAPTSELASGSC